MKIRTFLQIVRLGKITASRKANLSINKTSVYPQIQTRTHDADLDFKQNLSDSLFSKFMILNLLCAPPVAMFIYEDFAENWSAKILLGTKMSLTLWIEYLAMNTIFIFAFFGGNEQFSFERDRFKK